MKNQQMAKSGQSVVFLIKASFISKHIFCTYNRLEAHQSLFLLSSSGKSQSKAGLANTKYLWILSASAGAKQI